MADVLRRRIGLGLLTAYGVGVMVGAGIYVLVGIVIGQAGVLAPIAFLLAALVALPSAMSFAELAGRMPEAAGEVAYIEAGFDTRWLAIVAGLVIVVAGIVSAGAVLRGGVGYLAPLVPLGEPHLIVAGGVVLTLVAAIGVVESLSVAALFTVVEIIGLIAVSLSGLTAPPATVPAMPDRADLMVALGAIPLCFFAFIGFENIVNMAEEVHFPQRTIPRAILLSLAITTALYVLVSFAAGRAVPREIIAVSEQPLALVWQAGFGRGAEFLSLIAVAAALNGILAQIIMAARVLFGLGRRAAWLAPFTEAHVRFGTPVRATLLVGTLVTMAALALPVAELAEATTILLLLVFFLVNAALIAVKRRAPEAAFRVPALVPWAGVISSLAALVAALGLAA